MKSHWFQIARLLSLMFFAAGVPLAATAATETSEAEPEQAAQESATEPVSADPTELSAGDAGRIQSRLAEFVQQHGRQALALDRIRVDQDTPAELEALKAASDQRAYVRLALAYLTKAEPCAEFAAVLAQLTQMIEQTEAGRSPLLRQPLLPLLVDLGELVPPGNMSRYEIGFAAAMQARRDEDHERQEEILRALLDEDRIPDKASTALTLALGETLEARQRYREAVELYKGLSATGMEAGGTADGLLRGMLILLQLGEQEQAAELAARLRKLPAVAVAAAEASWQIGDLREAVDLEGGIAAHWQRSGQWWPRWVELRARLGVEADEERFVIPYLGQMDRVQQALMGAAREGRQREFFQVLDILAHAARWLPGGVSEWSSAVSPIGLRLAPNHATELRQLLIEMNQALEPVSHHQRRQQQLMLALAYIDGGDAEMALAQVEAFGSEAQPNDAVAQAIRRLWGLILLTLDRDLEPAIGQLNEALYGAEREFDRAATVATLADLLNASGKLAEERTLLSTELENPDVRRNQSTHQRLQQRYAILTQQSRALEVFHQAVRDWTDARNLEWFASVDPQSLDDPRLEDLEAVLRQPEDILSTPGVFKLRLLLATDANQPEVVQLESLSRAVDLLLDNTNSRQAGLRMVLDLVEDTRFPERLRAFVLARALTDAATRFDPHAITFLELPESGLFDDNQLMAAEIIAEFVRLDPNDGEALFALFERRARGPIDRAAVSITMEVARQLARIGRADLLAKIADRATELEFAVETQAISAEFALDLARLRRATEELQALNSPMSELVFKHYPRQEIDKPEAFDDLRDELELDGLGLEDALGVQLYLIKEGRVGFGGTEFWHEFIRNANFNNANPKLALELIKGLLEHETDDVRRSITVLYAPEFIDIDDPEDRDALFEILRPWEDRDGAPRTREMLAVVEAQVMERKGQAADWQRVFADNNHPIAGDLKPRYLLRKGLVENETDSLRRVLDGLGAQQMFADSMLPLTIPALAAAGLDAELQLAREAARRSARKLIQEAWMSADFIDASRALRLIDLLDDTSVELPQGWLESVAGRIGSQFRRQIFLATARQMEGDWQAALEAAGAAIDMVPTYYALYWERARILAMLERRAEALKDLEVFLKYCKDDLEYPDAEALRDDLLEQEKSTSEAAADSE